MQKRIAEGGQIAEQAAPGVSDASHTPTPWEVDDIHPTRINYAGTGDEITDTKYATELTRAAHEANAAFIVRAVNSHDALVKALEDARALIDVPGQPLWSDCRAAVDILNAALASAREVQP